MQMGAGSRKGRAREINEDAYLAKQIDSTRDIYLLAVADGMGGHLAGEIASSTAVAALYESIKQALASGELEHSVSGCMLQAFTDANEAIISGANEYRSRRGMGTTFTAALLMGNRVCIAHVGDSRAYVLTEGRLRRITQDHSLVAEMVRNGGLSEEEAASHPQRNVLTRALGSQSNVSVDVVEFDFTDRYVTVLVSDGVSGLIADHEIQEALSNICSAQHAADTLCEIAMSRGGYDDATCVIACSHSQGGEAV